MAPNPARTMGVSLEADLPASTVSLSVRPQPWPTAQPYPREKPGARHPAKLPPTDF